MSDKPKLPDPSERPSGVDRSGIVSLDDVPVAREPGASLGGPGMSGTSMTGLSPSRSLLDGLDLRVFGRKIGRAAAWIAGLFLVFLISAWVSLPTRSIVWRISHEARKAGFNINVDDISIHPWGSASLDGVTWSFKPSRSDSTPVPFVIKELDVSISILKYALFDTIDVEFEGEMDTGTLAGAFYKSDDESRIALDIADLPLYGVPKLQDAVNAPVRGTFAAKIDITAPGNEWAKAKGRVEVHCYSCTIGDGETKLYVPGTKKTSMLAKGVTIPLIDLGTLDGVLEIADGKAVAEEFGTESNDIVFKISGEVDFEDPLGNSRLDLLIKVFIDPTLRERSANIDLLVMTASPKVKMDPPDEGWMGVVLEGNFKHRRFRGVKSKSKTARLRAKRDKRRSAAKDRADRRAKQRAERARAKKAKAEKEKAEKEAEKAAEEELEADEGGSEGSEGGSEGEESGDEESTETGEEQSNAEEIPQ